MSLKRRPLSCTVLCYNEESNLEDCLRSVSWCDELIVVDSFSTDRTLDIAKQFTPHVFQHRFEGFAQQRLVSFSKASHEWLLYIDADERLSPDLQTEIQQLLSQETIEADGYELPRLNFYFGGAVRHGEVYPDYQLRLFRKGRFTMENLAVHESVKVTGVVKRLKHDIIHLTATDWQGYARKQDRYTTLEAEKKIQNRKAYLPPCAYTSRDFRLHQEILLEEKHLRWHSGRLVCIFPRTRPIFALHKNAHASTRLTTTNLTLWRGYS